MWDLSRAAAYLDPHFHISVLQRKPHKVKKCVCVWGGEVNQFKLQMAGAKCQASNVSCCPLLIFTPLSFEIIKSSIAVSLEEWQKARVVVWGKYSKQNYHVHTSQMFASKIEKYRMLFMQGVILSVFQQKPFVCIYFFWKVDEESVQSRRNGSKVMNKIMGKKLTCSVCNWRPAEHIHEHQLRVMTKLLNLTIN